MNTSSATVLDNELFSKSWSALARSQSKPKAKISYLMVEEVTPPSYMWDKITQQLDVELKKAQPQLTLLQSDKNTAILLITGAVLSIAAILYFLL